MSVTCTRTTPALSIISWMVAPFLPITCDDWELSLSLLHWAHHIGTLHTPHHYSPFRPYPPAPPPDRRRTRACCGPSPPPPPSRRSPIDVSVNNWQGDVSDTSAVHHHSVHTTHLEWASAGQLRAVHGRGDDVDDALNGASSLNIREGLR